MVMKTRYAVLVKFAVYSAILVGVGAALLPLSPEFSSKTYMPTFTEFVWHYLPRESINAGLIGLTAALLVALWEVVSLFIREK